MPQSNLQEPIEQKDLDFLNKLREVNGDSEKNISSDIEKKEVIPSPDTVKEATSETAVETQAEKISEKIETARQTISTQTAPVAANVTDDARSVAEIQEFEKKIEKLVEIAVQKGPEHAIQVAQRMDKGKDPGQADNYTLDEIHDRLVSEELRQQLFQKGLLKEL